MKYDVFISYSRDDFDEVNGFVEMLKRQIPSLSVWFDITGIESGDEFEEKIISAIDQSKYVIFALSDNSISSSWAKDEVMYAKNTDKKVVPVLLRGAQLKGWFLFKFGRVDCIDSTIQLQVDKLVNNISKWTNKPIASGTQGAVYEEKVPPAPPTPEPAKSQPKVEKKPQPEPIAKTYKVGDYYDNGIKQGVVFDVWDNGRHGKIVSLDQGEGLQWDSKTFALRVGTDSQTDGKYNTDKVLARRDTDKFPAFAWCIHKGRAWYLPAINELKLLLLNDSVHDVVNETLARQGGIKLCSKGEWEYYWSSTEYDRSCAWFVNMRIGDTRNFYKSDNYYVRAVSAF